MIRRVIISALAALALLAPAASAAGGTALMPLERHGGLDTLGFGPESLKKKEPNAERVGIVKEEASAEAGMSRKDPLVLLTEPVSGIVSRSFQRVSGRIGNGITKAYVRINDDTRIVPVEDGRFDTDAALRPGLNTITALAWDLEGNLGKYSMKVFYRPDTGGPAVKLTAPVDGASLDITNNRVIKVRAETPDKSVRDGVLVVNNMPRRVRFEKGVLSQDLALMPGRNDIFVEAAAPDGRAGDSRTVSVHTTDASPKDLVAVLTWDSDTADLDLHVWDSFGHHTFNEAADPYQCEAAIPRGMLDMDRKGGYGPEVFSLEAAEPEVYTFYASYNEGIGRDSGASARLALLLYGDEPARRIMRVFGPVRLDRDHPSWEAAHVKMPEGVFFQEKDVDLKKTLGMDSKAVARLALMLKEENPSFALLAISAMGQIKSEDAVAPLVETLRTGPVELRRAAAGALWSIRSVESVKGLVAALSDQDAEVRRAAAGALGYIGDASAFFALTSLLAEEGDQLVRIETIRALGGIADARALNTLEPMSKDSAPLIRVETMRAVGNIKDPRSETLAAEGLKDQDPAVREAAARALGKLGAKQAVRALSDLLYFDDAEDVRVQAAIALGEIGDQDSKEELERAADKDFSPKVRFCAGKALREMEPQPQKPKAQPAPETPPEEEDDIIVY